MFGPLSEVVYGDPPCAQAAGSDQQFIALLDAYRDSGGLARAPEVVQLFKRRCGCDITPLASWIANRKVICFEWQSESWLPLFQFNPLDMTLKAGLSLILAELKPNRDTWQVAHWFAQPNSRLGHRSPADRLGGDPAAVLDAARAACSVRYRTEQATVFS
jgi:hypothetical protein